MVIQLAMDKFGTFVAQESLGHLVRTPGSVLGIVKAIQGKIEELGTNLHYSFFIQKLLATAHGSLAAVLLQEEILVNIHQLGFNEVLRKRFFLLADFFQLRRDLGLCRPCSSTALR